MRGKLLLTLCLLMPAMLVAGDYWFNRSGAQDTPKKTEPDEKKGDLFDSIKQALEGKKGGIDLPKPEAAPVAVPPPSGLPPVVVDGPKPDAPPLPAPVKVEGTPKAPMDPVLPPLPSTPAQAPPLPAPVKAEGTPKAPMDPVLPPLPKSPTKGPPLPAPAKEGPPPLLNPTPQVPPLPTPTNVDVTQPFVDPPTPFKPAAVPPLPTTPVSGPSGDGKPNGLPFAPPPAPIVPPKEDAGKLQSVSGGPPLYKPEPVKTKTSPWALQVEVVDDLTIVTATVNKKHTFTIVCQNLELQTGKDTLKASGKVKITGDAINASCERLAISLIEDRLVLEGNAEMQIQKAATVLTSDNAKPAAFELRGEALNLRVSELQPSKYLQTSFQKANPNTTFVPPNANPPVITDFEAAGEAAPAKQLKGTKSWSRYGKLVRAAQGDNLWRLEGKSGDTMLFVEAPEGKSLANLEGRWVSVYGTFIESNKVRATHVALP